MKAATERFQRHNESRHNESRHNEPRHNRHRQCLESRQCVRSSCYSPAGAGGGVPLCIQRAPIGVEQMDPGSATRASFASFARLLPNALSPHGPASEDQLKDAAQMLRRRCAVHDFVRTFAKRTRKYLVDLYNMTPRWLGLAAQTHRPVGRYYIVLLHLEP